MELRYTATRDGRLSSLLREDMHISTGLMNRLKWQDKLFVNGVSRHTDHPVRAGDVITLPLEEPEADYPAQDGHLTVLYEDDHILAVDKPVGMLIHPSRTQLHSTLANYVQGYYRKTGQHCAFHPITRLDRDTFGIVLLAKNSHIHALLQRGSLQKTYRALVLGGPEADLGEIDAPIARKPLPSLLREIRPDGKPSLTRYRVLQRMDGFSLLELQPVTGRTHQLRLHCAHMGWPILGDPQYGRELSQSLSEKMGLQTQALCAWRLDLIHPMTGQPLHLQSKMQLTPED